MSRDLQDAVNNFALGFSLMDKSVARWEAAQAAKEKWKAMLQWRMADAAEKAKRNASYDALTKKHGELYDAQIGWYKTRGAGGGKGKVTIGSTGKPAFSPADQAYIDRQVAAGYTPPGAQETSQPGFTATIDMPEQPPQMPSLPAPPADTSSDSGASVFEQHGGMVPNMGVGGTSGPGSGFGVRATPPSYQAGGTVSPSEVFRQKLIQIFKLRPKISLAEAIAAAGGQGMGAGNTVPSLPLPTRPAPAPAQLAPASIPGPPKTDEGMDQFMLPRGGGGSDTPTGPPDFAGAASVRSADEDIHPPFPVTAGGARGGGRGAIDTGAWKKLGDQTRTKAYDPTKDWMDERNIGIVDQTGSGRVNPRVYAATPVGQAAYAQGRATSGGGTPGGGTSSGGMFDWAGRWAKSIFGPGSRQPWDEKPDSGPTYPIYDDQAFSGTGSTYQRGGSVAHYDGGGDVLHGILGTAGWAVGHLVPYVGPMVGKFLGHTGANLIEGKTGDIDNDASQDIVGSLPFFGGKASAALTGPRQQGVGDQIESIENPMALLGGKGFSGLFGGAGGAGGAGSQVTDAGSWGDMGGGVDMSGSGFSFRRGGRVGKRKGAINTRYQSGGLVPPYEGGSRGDDDSVLRPQMVPRFASVPVGRGRASLGATYEPESRYGGVEAGYEHPIGRSTTLGVQGHIGKDLGPEGVSARPDWGVGMRGRVRFQQGGDVEMASLTPEPSQQPVTFDQSGTPSTPPRPDPRGRAGAAADVGEGRMDPRIETRYEYENGLAKAQSLEEANSLWQDYKIKMRHLEPGIRFEDEGSPAETAGAGSVRSADQDIHPPSGAEPRGRSGAAGATEPDVPPQGRPAPRRGAVDTSRWKGLRDQTRVEAFDPTKDRADPYNVNIVDDTGRVNPQQGPPAPGGGPTAPPRPQAGEGPMGGYGLNPQGANARGAGLSTNNAANDMSPIMQAASDYAAHQFHLMANDEHSEGGYHALMSGHGAAPINMIDAGFKKIDPNGTMPPSKKIELLASQTYDYWIQQGQPEKASKVAFEIAQFGNQMAKSHAAQAGDLLQKGDFNGAMDHLVGGYNWLIDGHEASYDPKSGMITLRDSKTNQVTGQLPATPQLIKHLTYGMTSGELNWDIMRGRGGAQQAGQPPPGGGDLQLPSKQLIPGSSRPAVQPAAAPAGPTFTSPPAVIPPQGGGEASGSPADAGQGETQVAQAPPAAVQTTPPPQITPRSKITIPPAPVYDPNKGTFSNRPDLPPSAAGQQRAQQQSAQPTQTQQPTRTPAQGDQTEPVEGSDEWYEKHPNAVPNRLIRRGSLDPDQPPDRKEIRDELARRRKVEIDRIMSDAAHGNLSQSGKSVIPQFIAQVNSKYDKAITDLETRQKEYNTDIRDLRQQEVRNDAARKVQSAQTETNLDGKFEKYLTADRAAFDKMNEEMPPADRVKMIDGWNKPGAPQPSAKERADAQKWIKVLRSPMRYGETPDDRERLKDIATQIWITNPMMSERAVIEHAVNFTSFVPQHGKGHNQNSGDKGTNYRMLGVDPGRHIVLQNEIGDQVHVSEQTLREINTMRAANAQQFKEYSSEAAEKARKEAIRNKGGSMWSRTGKELRKIPPVDVSTGVLRGYGELMGLGEEKR